MSSTIATTFLHVKSPPLAFLPRQSTASSYSRSPASVRVDVRTVPRASPSSLSSSDDFDRGSCINRAAQSLKILTKAAILIGVATSIAAKPFPARAEAAAPVAFTDQTIEEKVDEKESPLTGFLESNLEAVESLKSLLQEKLQDGEDEEALKLLERLVAAQPSVNEWRFLMARLLSEMGRTADARNLFEEILARDPLSFEALFENALLMDRCGEGEAVIGRLQEALEVAVEEGRTKDARSVRLIVAQMQFLQKNMEGALAGYQELTNEDPNDYRPYFCRGLIYSLLDRNEEAREQFAKYHELSPKKFEVDGYLRTSLSRMKVFGTGEDRN